MVDLARQAFSTNNFGLAAEIYERTIKENGPQAELYLGLADSFARSGKFSKAFEAYTNAFRLGKVSPEKLKHLVTALIDSVHQESGTNQQQASMKKSCMFTCLMCRGLLNDPVTILCGHTFCRKCLERDRSQTCKVCGIVHYRLKPSKLKTNVVLSNLINKWFDDECRAAELKSEGNKYFERADYANAVRVYSEAIALSKTDHLLFSNRAHAYASLEQYSAALQDAEMVVKLRPDWPKGFYRKGVALYGLGQYEEAVIAFMQCLALDKEVTMAREYLSKCLHMILSRLPPDDPKSHLREQGQNPSLFQMLVSNNFNMAALRPYITMSTLSQLKRIMENTVSEATNFEPSQACSSSSFGASSQDPKSPEQQGSITEKQRCNSVPTLDTRWTAKSITQRQRSRSQSPEHGDQEASPGSRKRSRHPSTSQPLSPSHSSPQKCLRSSQGDSMAADVKDIDASLLNLDDLECSLCYRLFYQPVTTPCGHVFCRQCLDRCLDHQTQCPMCKSCLAEYLADRRQTVTDSLQAIIQTYFPSEYDDRRQVHEEEMNELAKMGLDNQHEIPIFVCTLSFPTVLCPLHIFEPRYRLMIRQCMESGTRQFGMCVPNSDNEEDFSDYGCMLEIRDVHYFPDGRSLVDTIGGRRFRVIGRSKRDGYNTAKVEFLSDRTLTAEELQEAQALEGEIYTQVKAWLDSLPGMHRARITQHFGNLPDLEPNPNDTPNGPAWAWWVVAVLPLDTRVQLAMLSMASYKERLQALQKVLKYLVGRRGR